MIVQPLDIEKLVGAIHQVHAKLATQAGRAVNVSLMQRNWMIGCYITKYEQNGAFCQTTSRSPGQTTKEEHDAGDRSYVSVGPISKI